MSLPDRLPHVSLGCDLGSAHVAIVSASGRVPFAPIPTIDIGEDEHVDDFVSRVVAEVALAVTESRCGRVVVEWGPYYCRPMPNESAEAFARRAAAMQRNRDATVAMLGGIERVCVDAGVPLTKIPAATWRSRIGALVSKDVPLRERRKTVDAAVRAALERHLGERAAELRDVHQRDAFGAILGALLAPEGDDKPRGKRTRAQLSEAAKKRNRDRAREDKRRELNRKREERGEAPKVYRDGKHPSQDAWERYCAEHGIDP